MRVGAGQKNRFRRQVRFLRDLRPYRRKRSIMQMDVVYNADKRLGPAIRQRETSRVKRIENTIRDTSAIVAGKRRADWWRYVGTGESDRESAGRRRLIRASHRNRGYGSCAERHTYTISSRHVSIPFHHDLSRLKFKRLNLFRLARNGESDALPLICNVHGGQNFPA